MPAERAFDPLHLEGLEGAQGGAGLVPHFGDCVGLGVGRLVDGDAYMGVNPYPMHFLEFAFLELDRVDLLRAILAALLSPRLAALNSPPSSSLLGVSILAFRFDPSYYL